ncbi:MAG: Nif3-like dinuclear metal center hexameric protein [Tissierellales bacterium]|nr:Nif3-like dinuclear metal center hexameric protein [Tissierellales bacterium]
MLVRDVIEVVEKFAPLFLAEEWDNSGLQIGNLDTKVKKILLSLDLTEEVVNKAIEDGYELIITHHPFLFNPIKLLELNTSKGRLIEKIIKNDLNIYSAHTNLDLAKGGVNDALATLLELKETSILSPICDNSLYKIAVYVPKTHEQSILDALSKAGAGAIGNYSDCSFAVNGIGRFKPKLGSNPFIGELNKIEQVEEVKVEAIATKDILDNVITEIKKAHPYEEVALDVFKLENYNFQFGYGRVGNIEQMQLREFIELIKIKLDTDKLLVYSIKDDEFPISKVAVCGGSGSDFITLAKKNGADLYITSDIKYHDAQLANELDLILIDAGHFFTEIPVMYKLKELILENFKEEIECTVYRDYC